MDENGLEGFEELFGLDITNDDLTESFNSGPITFDNLFEETDLSKFDSIVPDDISNFLDTQITEVDEDFKITEDVFNINIENVYDNNNNKSDSDNTNTWDNLDLGIEGYESQLKVEPIDSSEIDMANDLFLSPASLAYNVNHVPFFDFLQVSTIDPKIDQVGSNENEEKNKNKTNKTKKDKIHDNGVSIVNNIKREAKYPILTIINQERAEEENKKTKKGNQSPIRKLNVKDSKSFHICNLCPFKTKEKSIIRMHQSFVHKMDAPKSEKKTTSLKSESLGKSYRPQPSKETVGRSYGPQPPKDYRSKKSQTITIKNSAPMINNYNKKCPTFVTPTPKSFNFPTIRHGFQGIGNDNAFPSSVLQHGEVKVEIGGSQLFSLPSCVMNVVNCQVIKPPPKKPVNILPKQPDYLLNRFHQTGGNLSQKSNERLLRNNQERQRRNKNKSALDSVKAMVPKLKYLEKPSKITILNETMEYVKILQKTEKEDLEEWEAQKKTFLKLKLKYRSLFL